MGQKTSAYGGSQDRQHVKHSKAQTAVTFIPAPYTHQAVLYTPICIVNDYRQLAPDLSIELGD